jgi:hypothetical protein
MRARESVGADSAGVNEAGVDDGCERLARSTVNVSAGRPAISTLTEARNDEQEGDR